MAATTTVSCRDYLVLQLNQLKKTACKSQSDALSQRVDGIFHKAIEVVRDIVDPNHEPVEKNFGEIVLLAGECWLAFSEEQRVQCGDLVKAYILFADIFFYQVQSANRVWKSSSSVAKQLKQVAEGFVKVHDAPSFQALQKSLLEIYANSNDIGERSYVHKLELRWLRYATRSISEYTSALLPKLCTVLEKDPNSKYEIVELLVDMALDPTLPLDLREWIVFSSAGVSLLTLSSDADLCESILERLLEMAVRKDLKDPRNRILRFIAHLMTSKMNSESPETIFAYCEPLVRERLHPYLANEMLFPHPEENMDLGVYLAPYKEERSPLELSEEYNAIPKTIRDHSQILSQYESVLEGIKQAKEKDPEIPRDSTPIVRAFAHAEELKTAIQGYASYIQTKAALIALIEKLDSSPAFSKEQFDQLTIANNIRYQELTIQEARVIQLFTSKAASAS